MGKEYVGITIGPIFDTILEAGSPAALWFGSTLFSDVSRRLYIKIREALKVDNPDNLKVYSPAFDEADIDGLKDGIGKYHDRIIFSITRDDIVKELDEVIELVKEETIDVFGIPKNDDYYNEYKAFLKKYLQINYCILGESEVDNENIILKISPYLDALELMKTFPDTNANNPISWVMTRPREGQSASAIIKGTKIFLDAFSKQKKDNDNVGAINQFLINDHIRDIGEIALGLTNQEDDSSTKIDHKYQCYYAVVNADADGMGKFLNSIPNEDVTSFSANCLEYDKEAANTIRDFGGMTIYAGGDDLLFLAPLKKGEKTVFDLCSDISDKFKEIMEKAFNDKSIPTVSFGIAIHFYKYPLYEALNDARGLLEKAKKFEGKNCTATNLEKHSGQSASIIVGNDEKSRQLFKNYLELPGKYMNNKSEETATSYLKNIGSSFEQHYALIKTIDDSIDQERKEPLIRHSWDNLFDNSGQEGASGYINELNNLYYSGIKDIVRMKSEDVFDENHNDSYLNTLLSVLRISKFLMEKPGEEDVISTKENATYRKEGA